MSWMSSVPFIRERRERCLLAISGLSPDLDGIGMVIDRFRGPSSSLYFDHHHYLGHNFFSAFILSAALAALARTQRIVVFFLSLLGIHLHFLCDIAGSRGPDGFQWPVYYLYPLSRTFALTWSGQWQLNAWQNQTIMLFLFALSLYVAATRRITFIEIVSPRLDREVFALFRKYVTRE